MKLSILIPVWNEKATVAELLRRVAAAPWGAWEHEVVIVDDGSTDGTREILKSYRGRPGYTVIFHEQNRGKAGAVATAIANASGDFLIIQDADLEYHPNDIPLLLREVEAGSAEVVFGSRNLSPETARGGRLARAGVWCITKLINELYGSALSDAWTCYKLFPRAAAARVGFPAGGFEGELLFTSRLLRAGYRIAEVPISYAPRTVAEGKKISYADGIRAIAAILRDRITPMSSRAPEMASTMSSGKMP